MKANELMIDDYVYNHRNWECPVVEIHKNSAIVIAKHYEEEEFLLSDLRPIPLTPEILEKNGFVVESNDCHGESLQYCKLVDGLWIDISGENFFEGKLEYVHQLKHALRLCKIEKEIVL